MIAKYNIVQKSNLEQADPHSNTGSDSQLGTNQQAVVEARIDNLSLLWLANGSPSILLPLANYLGIEFDTTDSIGRKIGVWWDRNYRSVCGCLLSERDGDAGKVYVRLSISGVACGRVGGLRLRSFMSWCLKNLVGLTCSRVDIAIDDYSKGLKLSDLEDACKNGNYSGFKECKTTVNYGKKHNGWTVNLGARSGEKFVRIYDKFAESKGEINCIRYEVEYSGERSNLLFPLLIDCPNDEREYQNLLINYAVSSVSFIEKNDKNVDRNELLDWWYEWLEMIKAAPKKLPYRRYATTINRKKRWIQRAVSKSLAMLCDAMGEIEAQRYLKLIIKEAKLRYKEFDLLVLKEYKNVNKFVENGYDIIHV
jgi:DNA relaxase NicK